MSSNYNSLKGSRNWNVLSSGKEPERVSDEDEVDSDEELKEYKSSSESDSDSEELVGSAETSDFRKDSHGTGTWQSEIVSEEMLGQREKRKCKVVNIGELEDCLRGSRAEPTTNNVGKWTNFLSGF